MIIVSSCFGYGLVFASALLMTSPENKINQRHTVVRAFFSFLQSKDKIFCTVRNTSVSALPVKSTFYLNLQLKAMLSTRRGALWWQHKPLPNHAHFNVELSRHLFSFSLVTEAPCNLLNHFVISSESPKMRGLQPWLLKHRT